MSSSARPAAISTPASRGLRPGQRAEKAGPLAERVGPRTMIGAPAETVTNGTIPGQRVHDSSAEGRQSGSHGGNSPHRKQRQGSVRAQVARGRGC